MSMNIYNSKSRKIAPSSGAHMHSLDWMRAFAIMCIVIIHICDPYALTEQFSRRWYAILGIEAITRSGLILFFLLSGFLLLKNYANKMSVSHFYKKRFTRILPLFIGWSYIYFILQENSINPYEFAAAILNGPVYYHLWFIYILLGLYLVTPFLGSIIVQADYKTVAKFVIFSIIIYTFVPILRYFRIDESLYAYLVPFWLVYFISGYLLKRFLAQYENPSVKILLGIYAVCAIAIFFLSFFKEDFASSNYFIFDPRPYDSNIFMYGASTAIFCLVCKYFTFHPPALIKFIADRSYGIYLSHAFFLTICHKFTFTPIWYVNIALVFIIVMSLCLLFEVCLIKLSSRLRAIFYRTKTASAAQDS